MPDINKISNANVYINEGNFFGHAEEVEPSAIAQVTSDFKALGMIGIVELFSGFEKLEGKIMFNSIYAPALVLVADATKTYDLQIRGNLETHNSEGLVQEVPLVIYEKIRFKKSPFGTYKQHESAKTECEYSSYYIKVEIDGNEVIEFDPIANIYKVGGVDKMANYRRNLGV